ncbi:hypothetical protein [Leptospira barantonii]|uniref:DUF5683 domain-containing protein n=1 Tax=Leptospira barantonii TaxID=2023184 RepID=A0ABX4NLY6_9LEPT|nr:hypothetical protein [Leptospira barantonii]PJZ57314.1 hypothetical protein CH367_11345 [Leptospira barantonii]
MVLKNASCNRLAIVILTLVASTLYSETAKSPNAVGSTYRNGILLLHRGPALLGEVSEFQDFYFIRNDKVGKKIPKDQVVDFVSEEYYKKIKDSSAFRSAIESLIFFHASSDKQWRGFPEDNKPTDGRFEDSFTLWIKIGLLVLTAAAYADAAQQNHSLQNSYSGFNDREKRAFQNSYQRYQVVAGLTVGFFAFSTIKAYVRFGRNENYKDLQIQGREIRSISEITDLRSPLSGIQNVQFGITHNF